MGLKKIEALDTFWHYALKMVSGAVAHIEEAEAKALEELGLVTVSDADEGAKPGVSFMPEPPVIELEPVKVAAPPKPPNDDGKVIEPSTATPAADEADDLLGEKAEGAPDNKMDSTPANKKAK